VPFYTNSQNQINAIGNRAHALDTNGTLAQTFYNLIGTEQGIGYIFLHGALPGTVSGFEIFGAYSGYGNGVAIHGRETRDILESSPGTNFGVDWETARDSWLDISQNINFTNVPQTWARANNEDERIINVNVGLANITASFPSNWLWSGALPTNMLNQNVYKIRVERVVANSTNYLADCSLIYTNHFNFDTNALAYINNSGLTNLTQEAAINTFTLAAKNHGYFANLIAFYPVLGGNTNTAAYDLVTSTNRGKFYGTSTVTTSGMASDGTSGYFNSFIVPSNVFAGFGTASFGMAISSTNACAYNDFAGCDNGSTYLFGLGNTVIATNYFSFSGPESFSTSTGFPTSSSTNFMGVMALMQNSTVNCVGWVNDALGNGGPSAVTSTILPALPVYFEANNHNNGLQYPSKAVENSIFFANYMTTNSMSLLIGDIQNMNSTLGR
jgi:hypothetical protein